MSLEPGGRADKYGNEYEDQFLARMLLRIVKGDYKSIIVEPIGANSDSVEFIVINNQNQKLHYQCKASNTTHSYWSISDLNSHNVFTRAKTIIRESHDNQYHFISPLSYGELPELCKRARTNSSIEEFLTYQLNNEVIRSTFNDCAKYFKIDTKDIDQCSELIYVLSNCYFDTLPTGQENTTDLNEHVGMIFIGKANSARCLLEKFIKSTGKYGINITANEIVDFMKENGFPTRDYLFSDNVLTRIIELNNQFYDAFQPIKGNIIHRQESLQVINEIKSGNSVILHGKAGNGKSGCVQEVIDKLNSEHILFLSLKLDKHTPSISADSFGKELGLHQSPVYCLHSLSAGNPCVLILDQLDYLRWTNQHSSNALDICKEFITQAQVLNRVDNGHISIVFVSRTFDLENDAGLRALFSKETLEWSKILINTLSIDDVKRIVGDKYDFLSEKLKKLLLTPSSLYIWCQLDDSIDSQTITSPFQLMENWWKQILSNCDKLKINQEKVLSLKNSIVKMMDSNSLLALPVSIFSDSAKELDALISNGLLIKSSEKIAFAHQSFLDYFAVSDMLREIYSGKTILELIGPPVSQLPNIRYRIIRILQNIVDTDEDIFIKVCQDILTSDSVRYYFKCSVFEITGQIERPSDKILKWIFEYFSCPYWHKYVYNTVYFGHSQFILDLDNHGSFNWLDEEGLALLRSINEKCSSFVLSKVDHLCLTSKENDLKVLDVLCHDPSFDSTEMLKTRINILKANPELIEGYWGVYHLVKNNSINLIPIVKLIAELSDTLEKTIHFGDDENIDSYAQKHYKTIIQEILPIICEKTKHFHPSWYRKDYSKEFCRWTEEKYSDYPAREIVKLVKFSMKEFAIQNPKDFISFVNNYKDLKSVVYFEIISNAIINLNVEHSDFAIAWLCSDPLNHIFIYTGNQDDYLFNTKSILCKFSPYCSNELYNKIESIILMWKNPSEWMIETYKYRLYINKEKKWSPVYYSYWGRFQKELLPHLHLQRMSKNAKELIGVLNRNQWINGKYNCGFSCGSAKSVVSPICGKTEKISDKKWLEIISTPSEKMKDHFSWKETKSNYIEANHSSFSTSLSNQALKEPARFARLSLQFPNDCYYGYISSVLHAMYNHNETITKVDFDLMTSVITLYRSHKEKSILCDILRLIKHRAYETWSQDILEWVAELAINSPDPNQNESSVFSSDDTECVSPNSLLTNAINCVRGCALETISALLWEHSEYMHIFKPAIVRAVEDVNDSVRFAVMFCVFPCYEIDQIFSASICKKLIEKDIRTLAFPSVWEIIVRDYKNDSGFYDNKLIMACDSEIKELNEVAAGLLCATSIFLNNKLSEDLLKKDYSKEQILRICRQAVSSFNISEHHQISKNILTHFLEQDCEIHAFGQRFWEKCVNIDRDTDFLIKLMRSKQNPYQLQTALEFINNQDANIDKYCLILKTIGENLEFAYNPWERESISEVLIKCIIKLLDKNKHNNDVINICLDIWDSLFKSSLRSIRSFTDIFDNLA